MFGTLKVTYDDGTVKEYEGKKSDAIRFERHFRKSATAIVTEATDDNGNLLWELDDKGNKVKPKTEVRIEYLWYFGYVGAMRDGDSRTFDEWMDSVESVDVIAAPKAKRSPRTPTR